MCKTTVLMDDLNKSHIIKKEKMKSLNQHGLFRLCVQEGYVKLICIVAHSYGKKKM